MIRHIPRDYTKTLAVQKKEILKQYPSSTYIMTCNGTITIITVNH